MSFTNCFRAPVILLVLFATAASPKVSANDRPNILFAFADDWGKFASAYADLEFEETPNTALQTRHFDRIADEGVLFTNAFVNSPSCTPCRSALLSGQYFFRTGGAAILQGAVWDDSIPSFPLLLRDAGYHIGQTYKVWSPGSVSDAPFGARKYEYESAGRRFNQFSQNATKLMEQGASVLEAKRELYDEVLGNFESFLEARPDGAPFCYWFGPTNVHRKWIRGSGKTLWGLEPDDLKGKLPDFLPDVHTVREDMIDYFGEVMAFDTALGVLLDRLAIEGELDNTVVVVSGDHGIPGFTNAKTNLYDYGTNVSLAIRWPGKGRPGRVVTDFVNLMDLAPTFLEIGGVGIPDVMTGRSLAGILSSDREGRVESSRHFVVTGRERHVAKARAGNLPYPHRAIRTDDFLYIRNFKPDRWPEGDPGAGPDAFDEDLLTNNTFVTFGDLDASQTKAWLVLNKGTEYAKRYYDFAFGKRPGEELYDVHADRDQVVNLASNPAYGAKRDELRNRLLKLLEENGDPRLTGDRMTFERPPFAGKE